MATSEAQKEEIRALFGVGDLSNVQIAKQVGVNEKTVRNLITKEGLKKSEISELAKREVQNIIMAKEIKSEKSEQSPRISEAYNEVFVDLSSAIGLFQNSTMENQQMVNSIQHQIKARGENEDDLYSLGAISKITETNRKQLFGITEPFKGKEEDEEDKIILRIE